jgi:hypothetical protein
MMLLYGRPGRPGLYVRATLPHLLIFVLQGFNPLCLKVVRIEGAEDMSDSY